MPIAIAIGIVAATVEVALGVGDVVVGGRAERGDTADRADLVAHHLTEALAIAACRGHQDREILHRAAEHHADQDVERARQVAELRGQDRPDERAGSGDRGEVMPEDDPAVGGNEVLAVGEPVRGGDVRIVEREGTGGEKGRIEAIGERVAAQRRHQEPRAREALAARRRDHADCDGGRARDRDPDQAARQRTPGHPFAR